MLTSETQDQKEIEEIVQESMYQKEQVAHNIVDLTTRIKHKVSSLDRITPLYQNMKQHLYVCRDNTERAHSLHEEIHQESEYYARNIKTKTNGPFRMWFLVQELRLLDKKTSVHRIREVEFKKPQEETSIPDTGVEIRNGEYVLQCIDYIEQNHQEYML